jgi:hypothetical protein
MSEQHNALHPVATIAQTVEEFDRLTAQELPALLERATSHTRRFLRESGQWADDISHEKLALRWGYELTERFLASGRGEVPCRPFLLLDSLTAKYLSQSEPLCYHQGLTSPLGRFLDGLISKAVVSRDALMALFYHLYGLSQGQVVRILGLGPAESQRVYKNFERWRRTGWQRALTELGMTDEELEALEQQKTRHPDRFKRETEELIGSIQGHYRKSEPPYFPCLSRQQWADIFEQGYGYDYRAWHLALCRDCLVEICRLRDDGEGGMPTPELDLQLRPLLKSKVASFVLKRRAQGDESPHPSPRVSAAPP